MKQTNVSKMKLKILHKEYSSFRDEIIEYFVNEVLPSSKAVLDPMAGTAPLIPYVERLNINSYFNDLIPVHFYINRAKSYKTHMHIKKITDKDHGFLRGELSACFRRLKNKQLIISDKWIPDEILDGLLHAWDKAGNYDKFTAIFFKAIVLLSVRAFSSISLSEKNIYWHRPGGMTTRVNLELVISKNVRKYLSYYDYFYSDIRKSREHCTFLKQDTASLKLKKKADTIITSPPYANRYDCTRMLAPELYFLFKTALSPDLDSLAHKILATNVVSDYEYPERDLSNLSRIAPKTYEFLTEVEKKKKEKSSYYTRYFTKYYSWLYRIFDNLLRLLSDDGSLFIVVQNNIHRGELNAMDEFISEFFSLKGLRVKRVFNAMRRHQGRRNISAEHPLVLKKHIETILRIKR